MPIVLVDMLSYTGTKGGMENYVRDLYTQIGKHHHEFEFIGLKSSEGAHLDMSWFPGETIDSGISGENRFRWAFGELWSVSRYARQRHVDLVHSPCSLGPRHTDMPMILTLHDVLYWSHPDLMSTPLYTEPVKWMEVQAVRNAAQIITLSEVSRQEILKYIHPNPDKVHAIWIDASRVVQPTDKPRRNDLILAMGNRRPHKNFDALIRALSLIPADSRPHLAITGSRGDDPLRPLVEELGLQSWVDLLEWLSDEDLADLQATATAIVMPSRQEGFGIPTVEAMRAGIPLVVSDLPVFREIVSDAALFINPLDDNDIANALLRITTDSNLRQKLVEAGIVRARMFSWEETANATLDIFRKALAHR